MNLLCWKWKELLKWDGLIQLLNLEAQEDTGKIFQLIFFRNIQSQKKSGFLFLTFFCRIGDDRHSWAYDGERIRLWFSSNEVVGFGRKWHTGDVVGCCADLEVGKKYVLEISEILY